MLTAIIAAIHYLALAIGFAGLILRLSALASARAGSPLKLLYLGDNLWGVAALLWIATGLGRVFGGLEKGSAFYLASTGFWIKMGLFLVIFLLEIKPMITLIRWRLAKKAVVAEADLPALKGFAHLSRVQIGLTLLIPIFASLMARALL